MTCSIARTISTRRALGLMAFARYAKSSAVSSRPRGGPGADQPVDRGCRADAGGLMSPISRGFMGRRRPVADPSRVPPGQYLTEDFPVLSAGPTPHTPLDEWSFTVGGAVGHPMSWSWREFIALPSQAIVVDIHCVTKWSK